MKQFTVEYGGIKTTFRQDESITNFWHWVCYDGGRRVDGAEADSTAVLYMLWQHLQDHDCKITAGEAHRES